MESQNMDSRNLLKFCNNAGELASQRFQENEITSEQMETVYNGLVELGKRGEEIISIITFNTQKHTENISLR